MANKGRIQEEMGNFLGTLQICEGEKLAILASLQRRLQDTSPGMSIRGEIKEQNLGRKFDCEEREIYKI